MMDQFELVDLFPYLTWNCPLHDSSYAATLARIIVGYIGKQEITLTMVGYQSECNDLSKHSPSLVKETVIFGYKTCCMSTNGSFYLIEDKFLKKRSWVFFYDPYVGSCYGCRWDDDWDETPSYHSKNLRYIDSKEISDIQSIPPIINSDDNTVSSQKYFKTMINIQQANMRRDLECGQETVIEKLCVIDLQSDDDDDKNSDEKLN